MQKRFIEHQVELLSFETNEKYSGILPSAVYRGFDGFTAAGLTLSFNHLLTGEVFTDINQELTSPRGIWVSRQGTVIKEDENISVPITLNPNNYERWDILIAEHTHDSFNQGGVEATYSIIAGGNQTEPTNLQNNQTIIGRLRVPPNTTSGNTSNIVWERRKVPQLGGKFPALLAENNIFTAQNSDNHQQIATTTQIFDGRSCGIIQLMNNANSYLVTNAAGFNLDLLPLRPIGTEIALTFNNNITLLGFGNQLIGSTDNINGYTSGYRPLSLSVNDPSLNLSLLAGETALFRLVEVTGGTAKRPHSQYWSLVSVTDTAGRTLQILSTIGGIEGALNNHIGDTDNPHNVTKQQVGLGNIPNSVSSSTTLNSQNTLATSKAVRDLGLQISSQIRYKTIVPTTLSSNSSEVLKEGTLTPLSFEIPTIDSNIYQYRSIKITIWGQLKMTNVPADNTNAIFANIRPVIKEHISSSITRDILPQIQARPWIKGGPHSSYALAEHESTFKAELFIYPTVDHSISPQTFVRASMNVQSGYTAYPETPTTTPDPIPGGSGAQYGLGPYSHHINAEEMVRDLPPSSKETLPNLNNPLSIGFTLNKTGAQHVRIEGCRVSLEIINHINPPWAPYVDPN